MTVQSLTALLALMSCCYWTIITGSSSTDKQVIVLPAPLEVGEVWCNCSSRGCGEAALKDTQYQNSCRTKGGCSKKMKVTDAGGIDVQYSCVPATAWHPPEKPIFCQVTRQLAHTYAMACCRTESFCNSNLHVEFGPPPTTTTRTTPRSGKEWQIAVFILVPALLVIVMLIAYLLYRKCSLETIKLIRLKEDTVNRNAADKPLIESGGVGPGRDDLQTIADLLQDAVDDGSSSGSGSGLPLLVQRTVARQIELIRKVGEGRFGMVWLALWKGEEVAVKLFETRDEKSWFREVEIFQTNMLRHPNVLGFFASDNKDATTHTQLWLVTEYHPKGSLYDFLKDHTISMDRMCLMARSIANGLSFLHSENVGTHCKPAIAHRDIKSKNILVKLNHECCIADLGMAVRYTSGVLDMPDNGKVGTRRYLAPEILDDRMNTDQFDSFRRADIYSLGLTLWEICRRTRMDDLSTVGDYELPYFADVPSDPSVDDMKRCVVADRIRPNIPNTWTTHRTMAGMAKLLRECWADNPNARLPPLRIRKSIDSLSVNCCAANGITIMDRMPAVHNNYNNNNTKSGFELV